jgi:sugar lactone lactonase YvrE
VKKALQVSAAPLLIALLYLGLWPVPIEPVAWQAPVDRGLVDPFAPNDLLKVATGIDLGTLEGPEDATLGRDLYIYVTTLDGQIARVRNRRAEKFAFVDGRPLGIETADDGALIVANSFLGLQRVDMQGNLSTLLGSIDGQTPVYPNNLAIADDGKIYFTEASSKFGADKYRGTYNASLLDIMEHGGHGSVVEFDPASGIARTLLDGLNYANGIAISADNRFLLVAETGSYRVIKYWLTGTNAGQTEVVLENLPGFPDNIKSGLNGRFWVGLAAPRNALLDKLSDKPWLRKVVQRLPAAMRPQAVASSHVIAFNGTGQVLMNLYDPEARFPTLTGVLETKQSLYLTTLFGHELPVIAKRDL